MNGKEFSLHVNQGGTNPKWPNMVGRLLARDTLPRFGENSAILFLGAWLAGAVTAASHDMLHRDWMPSETEMLAFALEHGYV